MNRFARWSKNSKYGSKKTLYDGITFDSGMEARRYSELRLLEKAGEIENLELQPRFILIPKQKRGKITIRQWSWTGDFRYFDKFENCEVIEDVKGYETVEFRNVRKMFLAKYPEKYLRIVTKKEIINYPICTENGDKK
jgi:hypothetical protein